MGVISDSDKKYFLSLNSKDITFEFLCDLFAHYKEDTDDIKPHLGDAKYECEDILTLTPDEYFVTEKTETTLGAFLYNKYIVEGLELQNVLGYVNWELTAKGVKRVESILSAALTNAEIDVDKYVKYIDYRDWLGSIMHFPLACSMTSNLMKTPKEVIDLRNKLFEENKDAIKKGDILVSEKIEKATLSKAKEILGDDPGMELYDSGSRGSFDNNYKNINIMKGAVFNNITGQYDIIKSSHLEGMSKEELNVFGNSIISGAYPKAVGTQISGYFAKEILAALQTEMLDKKGSDCKTKRTIKFKITNNNSKDFEYRYIQEGNKYICLTPDVISRYIDKDVNLRTPMTCCGNNICNICAGDLFYKLDIDNVGLTASRVANTLTNLGMKKFHDSTIHSTKINIDDILI